MFTTHEITQLTPQQTMDSLQNWTKDVEGIIKDTTKEDRSAFCAVVVQNDNLYRILRNNFLSAPLAERLADEEREKILKLYFREAKGIIEEDCQTVERSLLVHIFGKEMFEKEGGSN